MMLHNILIYIFAVLIVIHDSSGGEALKRPIREIGSTKCDTLDKLNEIIDSLKNVTLDAWPWDCLNSRFNSSTMNDLISNSSSLYDAASNGYIGFVQYYAEKMHAELSLRNHDGETPLHLAVKSGRLNIVKYIASKVSLRDLNTYSDDLLTPLMCAAYYGQLEIVKYLLDEAKADSAYDEDDKNVLLKMAARGGNLTVLQYIVDIKNYTINKRDSKLLLSAAEGGNVDLIKYLIYTKNLRKTGTSINTGNTALHMAALRGRLEAVKFFTDTLNYSVDVQNLEKDTPAHSAAQGGSVPVLKFLIDERYGNVNAENTYGHSILHTAAFYGQLEIVKYLVDEKKLNIELTDNTFRTPIYRAVHENKLNVVKYLAEEKRANLKHNSSDRNLLHEAVYSTDVEMMKYLIDDQKMIDRIDEVDRHLHRTPALHAADWGQLAILKFLLDERKANASIVDWEGENLLHTAARAGKLAIIKYLIEEKNFDVNAKTPSGLTVYDLALKYEYRGEKLLGYLRQKMKPELLPKN